MSSVLIVDDEPAICWALREALTDDGHAVSVAASAEEALRQAEKGLRPNVVVMDVRLPGMDGLSAMRKLRERIGDTPVVVMTAFGSLETAVRAIEEGAFDYLVKPIDLDQATDVLRRAVQANLTGPENESGDSPKPVTESIIGTSPVMQQVFKQIALAAASDVSILITGESGTGKELVARAIHRHSPRKEEPYLPVCIPALNPSLIESELFGHVRGSFTGATKDRIGLLELAGAGTILLDEIADVPPTVQVKLLRALEQREVLAVGDTHARPLNLRVLAATNRSLPDLIAAGQFREDLYFRLGVFRIHLPPLRERGGDIPLLCEHFLRQVSVGRPRNDLRLSTDAMKELEQRPWPGNVRELRNAVEHAAIVARSGEIQPHHLPPALPLGTGASATPADQTKARLLEWTLDRARDLAGSNDPQLYERFLELVEPPLLEAVLKQCGQNRGAAAELLGLHRATLRQKLRRHGLG